MTNRFLLVLLLFLTYGTRCLSNNDSLIREGRMEFCRILTNNDVALQGNNPDKMEFVIDLSGENDPTEYVTQRTLANCQPDPRASGSIKDSINAEMRAIYTQYGVELFFILISSLDVVVNTPLPANATARDLFTRKLYDDRTNIALMRSEHQSITDGIVNSSIAGYGRDCIIFSSCSYLGRFTPDTTVSKWIFTQLSAYTAQPSTFPDIVSLRKDFTNRLKNAHFDLFGESHYSLLNAIGIFEESASYFQRKAKLLSTYTSDSIADILSNFHGIIDYQGLSLAERRHILSVFAGYTMLSTWFNSPGEEDYAICVIKFTPKDQVSGLITTLSLQNYLKTNPNYHGDKNDKVLIVQLIDHTDDAILTGDDNYTKLIRSICTLMTSSEEVFNDYLPTDDAGWHDRQIIWDNYSENKIGDAEYTIDVADNGEVTVNRSVYKYIEVNFGSTSRFPGMFADTSFKLNPFALVFFKNRSNINMLAEAGVAPNEVLVAPAIFLKYVQDKGRNQEIKKMVAVALDVIAVATGPGLIIDAIEVGNIATAAFEALQLIGATLNIAANAINDPELQSVVDDFNSIVAIWGITRLAVSATKFSSRFFSAARLGNIRRAEGWALQQYRANYAKVQAKLADLEQAESFGQTVAIQKAERAQLKAMDDYCAKAAVSVLQEELAVSFGDFVNTVDDFKSGPKAQYAQHSYDLYKEKKWSELEAYFTEHQINVKGYGKAYPPNFGGYDAINKTLDPSNYSGGLVIERYGDPSGYYASPQGTTFEQRALPYANPGQPPHRYKVLKSIPNTEEAKIIPWFGQEGNGIQYKFTMSIEDLVTHGYLELIP
jgi:hypothetical protein